jgi:MFS superfamily sulfate permease-like transporter
VALSTAGLLLLARLLKLGFLADFLSRTVLIAFLTGVGFQVGIAVINEMLKVEVRGSNPVGQLLQIAQQLPHTDIPTLCLSAGVAALVLLLHRFEPRFPGALLAVVGAVAASAAFDFSGHGIQVVGPITGGLPHFSFPSLSWGLVHRLLPVAGSCFVMIVAQSSVTARAYAAKHHQVLDENRDLLGISAANVAAALSGTFVVNGSILALVLSLLQHVRHSYQPPAAVETRTADGHWQMSALETGRMAAPGLLVYWFGSDLFYANVDRFATQAHKLATESPSRVRWLVVDAGALRTLTTRQAALSRS